MTNAIIKIGTAFFDSKIIGKAIKMGTIFIFGLICGYAWAWKIFA